ncbi:MAG: FAD/NAD(P)-binding protein [Pseudomonadota bacterium]
MIDHVAIIGAGFSGTLQAINLLRHGGPRATLIERAPVAGLGLAYGAAHADHVLNVRAGNMSAFPDEPDHFVRWLESQGVPNAASAFVPRMIYGAYLRTLLDETLAKSGDRLRLIRGDAVSLDHEGRARVRMRDGHGIAADAVVLAMGNLPPHDPPGLDAASIGAPLYMADPWNPLVADGLRPDDTVMLIGTGLTMIDIALLLEARGFAGRIIALSRRGLTPHRHAPPVAPWQMLGTRPGTVASALVRAVRRRSDQIGWRQAIDELRPYTQTMWANASTDEKARMLRHLRPWWDVHRHRLAPEVADRFEAIRSRGQLSTMAARTLWFHANGDGVELGFRRRGKSDPETMRVNRIVNCTGPQGDLQRSDEPLLATLRDSGMIRPDAARIGIDVDNQARVIGADGQASTWLHALGPMTRGAFWEIVAVPDIRVQTWTLARRLSNAQWVGGEGL